MPFNFFQKDNGKLVLRDPDGVVIATFDEEGNAPDATFLDLSVTGTMAISGTPTYTTPIIYDTNTTITAFSGGGVGSAVALTGEFNNVTTVAADFDSVKLLTAILGQIQIVKNSGANIVSVFPNTSDSIDALAVNLSVDVPVGATATFRAKSGAIWESDIDVSTYLSAPTTQKGGVEYKAANNSGNTIVTHINASHGQNTVITDPDVGLATSFTVQSTAALTAGEADLLDISAQTETVIASGTASVTKRITQLDSNAGAGSFTLAAPDATMIGQVKIIEMVTAGNALTLSLANVQGGSAATTASFDAANETLTLIGGTNKWTVLNETGVTLS